MQNSLTPRPDSLRGIVAYLRSACRSGEKLSPEDEVMIDVTLARDASGPGLTTTAPIFDIPQELADLKARVHTLTTQRDALRKAVEEAVYQREAANWPAIRSLLAKLENEEP